MRKVIKHVQAGIHCSRTVLLLAIWLEDKLSMPQQAWGAAYIQVAQTM